MHTAIGACLYVSGMAGEIGIFTMLNNEPSVFFENVLFENQIG